MGPGHCQFAEQEMLRACPGAKPAAEATWGKLGSGLLVSVEDLGGGVTK
jgi:hypothetical protein